jgi:hypothetical protein
MDWGVKRHLTGRDGLGEFVEVIGRNHFSWRFGYRFYRGGQGLGA